MRTLLRSHRRLPMLVALAALATVTGWSLTGVSSEAHEDHGAFLGVQLDRHPGGGDAQGARIDAVVEGSPAERAGLEEGDIVVRFDGNDVRGARELSRKLDDYRPGDRVDLVVMRDGREKTITVELGDTGELIERMLGPDFGERISAQLEESLKNLGFSGLQGLERLESLGDLEGLGGLQEHMAHLRESLRDLDIRVCDDGDCSVLRFGSGPRLGVEIVDTTPELRRHLGGDDDAGVLVSRVHEDSPADLAGVRVGDLITAIDGEVVVSAKQIRRAIRELSGQTLRVTVIRDGARLELTASLPEVENPDPAGLWHSPAPGVRDSLRSAIDTRRGAVVASG